MKSPECALMNLEDFGRASARAIFDVCAMVDEDLQRIARPTQEGMPNSTKISRRLPQSPQIDHR